MCSLNLTKRMITHTQNNVSIINNYGCVSSLYQNYLQGFSSDDIDLMTGTVGYPSNHIEIRHYSQFSNF